MKKIILGFFFLLFINACFAQPPYYDTIGFEGGIHNLRIDTSQANNLWQVGKPSKIVFNSAYSIPSAIVTDTINPYPPNNISSFTICEPLIHYNLYHLSFTHKYNTDYGK